MIMEYREGTVRGMARSDGEGFSIFIILVLGIRSSGVYQEQQVGGGDIPQKKMDSASISVTIVNQCRKMERTGKLELITSGFGIGLSWAVVSFVFNTEDMLPLIIKDEYFLEGKDV